MTKKESGDTPNATSAQPTATVSRVNVSSIFSLSLFFFFSLFSSTTSPNVFTSYIRFFLIFIFIFVNRWPVLVMLLYFSIFPHLLIVSQIGCVLWSFSHLSSFFLSSFIRFSIIVPVARFSHQPYDISRQFQFDTVAHFSWHVRQLVCTRNQTGWPWTSVKKSKKMQRVRGRGNKKWRYCLIERWWQTTTTTASSPPSISVVSDRSPSKMKNISRPHSMEHQLVQHSMVPMKKGSFIQIWRAALIDGEAVGRPKWIHHRIWR